MSAPDWRPGGHSSIALIAPAIAASTPAVARPAEVRSQIIADGRHQLMALPGADEVVAAKIEDDLSAAHFARNVGIDVGRGVAGDLEREQLPRGGTIVLSELLKFVGDLPVVV